MLALAASSAAHAQSVEEFYKGKTITLAIGFRPAAATTSMPGLVARHMGKHIPGKPNIVAAEHAGAGSLRAAQHLVYSARPRTAPPSAPSRADRHHPLLETGATFDGTKFTWLGSVTNDSLASA